MAVGSDEMWTLMMEGSEELAEEIGLADNPYSPRRMSSTLEAIDGWVGDHDGALGEDDLSRLGLLLARLLVEAHGGGLVTIRKQEHDLDGEWAVTGFAKGLGNDYHVPFAISASRIGVDHSLTAREWYRQLKAEGRDGE